MTRAPENQRKSEKSVVSPGQCLPDETWLRERAELIARVRRSFPSQIEMGLLTVRRSTKCVLPDNCPLIAWQVTMINDMIYWFAVRPAGANPGSHKRYKADA